MKRFAQILIVALLLAGAGRVWAMDITIPDEIVFPPGASFPVGTSFPIDLNGINYITSPTTVTFPQGLRIPAGRKYLNVYPDSAHILALDPSGQILTPTVLQHNINQLQNYVNSQPNLPANDPSRNDLAALQTSYAQRNAGTDQIPYDPTGGSEPADNLPICWSWKEGLNIGNCLLRTMGWFGQILVWLFSWLVYAANEIFDMAINISVRQFTQYANLPGVVSAWRICRNLVNISFIFVLLYVAIGTILRLDSVNGKKLLSKIIIAALLVNFSAFFTRIMIDASNVVANQFYTAAAGNSPPTRWGAPDLSSKLVAADTNAFFSLKSAFGDKPGEDNNLWNQMGALLGSYFGQIVLMLITTTVLLAGAVMFLMRTIVLIFVIVLSPLAFLGFAVGGKLGQLAGDWRQKLFNQLIFAPVYLLLIYLTIQVVGAGGDGGLAALVGGDGGLISSLVVFAIVNGLMLGSLLAAKNLGVAGATGATKLGGSITGFGAKVIGRTTVGFASGTTRNLYGGVRQAITGKDAGGRVASRLQGLGMALRSPASGLATGAQAGVKAMQSGGGVIKAAKGIIQKPGQAINEAFASATGIKILGPTRDDEKEAAKRAKEKKEEEEKEKLNATKEKLKNNARDLKSGVIKPGTPEEKLVQDELKKLSDKDVVALDPETMVELAHLFSNSQINAISRSDMSQDKRDEILDRRSVPFALELKRSTAAASASGDFKANSDMQKVLKLMNPDRLGKFISALNKTATDYRDQLRMIAVNINKSWINEMTKNGSLDFDVAVEMERMI